MSLYEIFCENMNGAMRRTFVFFFSLPSDAEIHVTVDDSAHAPMEIDENTNAQLCPPNRAWFSQFPKTVDILD